MLLRRPQCSRDCPWRRDLAVVMRAREVLVQGSLWFSLPELAELGRDPDAEPIRRVHRYCAAV